MYETAEEIQRHIVQLEEFLRKTTCVPERVKREVQEEISDYRMQLFHKRHELMNL
ncbi:hypothetical protein DNHGIG_25490 [Collibacillus ludicampi]|uniref:Uncharacterized protein n=1 Tax=Collibacillus ludicampi TaxID=2771369 RepID=A0AAV4LGK7_9BACL|nr:hypothetical protein DNHGIG_25490 [Collibacillus ludicampi]